MISQESYNWFFNSWVPRTCCGPWTDLLVFLYTFAHISIFLAYLLIPIMLVYFYFKNRNKPYKRDFVFLDLHFAFFILWCGIGHFLDFYSIWWVSYPVHTIVAWFTAIFSWMTLLNISHLVFPKSFSSKISIINSQLDILMKESNKGIYFIGINENILWCNDKACEILNCDRNYLIGKNKHKMLSLCKKFDDNNKDELCDVCLNDRTYFNDQFIYDKDNNSIPVTISSHPIRDDEKNIVGSLIIFDKR